MDSTHARVVVHGLSRVASGLGDVVAVLVTVVAALLYLVLAGLMWLDSRLMGLVSRRERTQQTVKLSEELDRAQSYEEFRSLGLRLDELEQTAAWKADDGDGQLFDAVALRTHLVQLQAARRNGDLRHVAVMLRKQLVRSFCGISNPRLFTATRVGTKTLIECYQREVLECLKVLREAPVGTPAAGFATPQERFDFFWESRQNYGRTALLLSGGAAIGMYHIGVVKALLEAKLLPRVISGSSVGSIVAAMVAVHTEDELPALFVPEAINLDAFDSPAEGSLRRKLHRLLTDGVLMDVGKLQRCLRDNIGDVTFLEAFQRTGRVLNVTVSSTVTRHRSRLLNYLSSPDVLIWSAALASCAIPWVYAPVEILEKRLVPGRPEPDFVPWDLAGTRFIDGSVHADLPMQRLSELFAVNHFVVSQVNPHVVPFLSRERPRSALAAVVDVGWYLVCSELVHRAAQLQRLRLLPRPVRGLMPLLTQRYTGDITFVPKLRLSDYANAISNPTPELLRHAIAEGQRQVFRRMDHMRANCAVEIALAASVALLRESEHGAPLATPAVRASAASKTFTHQK